MNTGHGKTKILNYLLGALPEKEQERFEERYFSDDELLLELLDTEDQLIQHYLESRLNPGEKEQFERHYLSTAAGREKVNIFSVLRQTEMAKTMIQEDDPEDASGHIPWKNSPSFWSSIFIPARLIPGFAPLLILILVLAAIGWQLFRSSGKPGELASNAPATRQADAELGHARPSLKTNAGQVEEIELEPGAPLQTRDARSGGAPGKSLRADPEIKYIQVKLKLKAPIYLSYKGRVLDLNRSGLEVSANPALKPEGENDMRYILWKLGTDVLPVGDYQFELRGVGRDGEIPEPSTYDLKIRLTR